VGEEQARDVANDLLRSLRSRGFVVRLREDGMIGITPAERLTEADRQAIRGRRDSLLDALWAEPHPSDGRAIGWPADSPSWDGSGWKCRPMTTPKEGTRKEK
jgi:hypothetical protein